MNNPFPLVGVRSNYSQDDIISFAKAEIVKRGAVLGVDFAATVSCYQATAAGLACGRCDACRIRRAGFEAAGQPDPTRYTVRAAAG